MSFSLRRRLEALTHRWGFRRQLSAKFGAQPLRVTLAMIKLETEGAKLFMRRVTRALLEPHGPVLLLAPHHPLALPRAA